MRGSGLWSGPGTLFLACLLIVQPAARAAQPDAAPSVQLPALPALPAEDPGPVRPAAPLNYADYRAGAFRASQWAYRTQAAIALERVAARFAAGDDALGRLERDLQATARTLRLAEQEYAQAVGAAGGVAIGDEQVAMARQAGEARNALRQRIATLQEQLEAQVGQIERRYPAYSELIRPRAYDFAAVQALLREDEALLVIVNAEDASYLFAVTRDRREWFRSPELPRSAVEAAVNSLRLALDPARRSNAPFDRRVAHRLYRHLIAPANELIGGKRVLMTVTNGALATLPLAALVTDEPSGSDDDPAALAATRWLGDRHVLATLPAVSSLVALRCLLAPTGSRSPGCPADLPADPSRASTAGGGLALVAAGAPVLPGDTSIGLIPPSVAPAGQIRLADPNLLRRLESLPGALAELRALAGRYGERAEVMVEGGATEAAVKASAAIRSARYVVFSTHGLLAGQAGVPGEPGLVFTPPAGEASETDDGFLSASEVAQMRFAAELVVLSACNTAAGGGRYGGEGLSGLARAFFFAGARAILVSHWSVSDLATSELIAGAFGALDQDRTLSRGVAIQRAMQQVRADPRLRSPRYWAAFTLVGDPS